MANGYWLETLGCPKNQVDSEKLAGTLTRDGLAPVDDPESADLVVVNTCAFIEAARQESVETILHLASRRKAGARLVVTGCMAERYGDELAALLPEVDLVAGFGTALDTAVDHATAVAVAMGPRRSKDAGAVAGFDLLELPRPASNTPWAYVKVAEGCDRSCGFCAIPSFRGAQRSRPVARILEEVRALAEPAHGSPVREIVLVAQDLASYGRDRSAPAATSGAQPIVELVGEVSALIERVRLLYLYPTGLTEPLIEAILATGVPYFDLSLQHVAGPLVRRMRRWGDAERYLERIEHIRALEPDATFRSSFLLGYPGEAEEDHDALLAFLEAAQLDWCGFFTFSSEEGTVAAGLDDQVPAALALERLTECSELQDAITATRRDAMVGRTYDLLVDAPGRGRTVHEAPQIDGIVHVPDDLAPGTITALEVTESLGTDLLAAGASA
jgi:ribosomal protein S12 methylthiotransferase